jgi:FlaA1/EpsC-like NDP-sugar epimerase
MNIKELLKNKKSVNIPKKIITFFYKKKILITGAAGSIGATITKALAEHVTCKLILVDQSESGLYELQQKLKANGCQNFNIVIGDICDETQMDFLFKTYNPDLIYHTAAYKHVPLTEENWYAAIKTNVIGTKILADLSQKYKLSQFIYVSTDKAVNPKSIMGATKRVAELYLHHLNKNSQCLFKMIRFGNVPYSNGSVLPLFEFQLANQKKIEITHKKVTRYFINSSKVCEALFLMAIDSKNEFFIVEMGEQIPILEVALHFIKAKGLKPFKEVPIKFIGMRPGEKLHEELQYSYEVKKANNETELIIPLAMNVSNFKIEDFNTLLQIKPADLKEEVVISLKKIIPEFDAN